MMVEHQQCGEQQQQLEEEEMWRRRFCEFLKKAKETNVVIDGKHKCSETNVVIDGKQLHQNTKQK